MRAQRGARLRRLAEIARRQGGVISHAQLLAIGFSASATQRLVACRQLHVVFRGVYAVGHAVLPPRGRFKAAVLACGSGALVGYRSAGKLLNLVDDARAVIDVVGVANRRSRKGLVYHRVRSLGPEDCGQIDGIPVTSVARTLLDLATVIPQRRLVYAIEQAERMEVLDMRAVERVMTPGRRGVERLRAAVAEVHPEAKYTRSKKERLLLEFCRKYGLPDPTMNAVVEGLTVDALWSRQKVIVELDSWGFHRGKRAFEDDRRRDARLKLAGYTVLRVTPDWLKEEPEELAKTIRALLSVPLSPAATP
jgi:very-short-patch-repair endonuclease